MNYLIHKGGQWTGPYATDQIKRMIGNGTATAEDYICQEGTQDTVQIKQVPDLLVKPPTIPPPPFIPPQPPPPRTWKEWFKNPPKPVPWIVGVLLVLYCYSAKTTTKQAQPTVVEKKEIVKTNDPKADEADSERFVKDRIADTIGTVRYIQLINTNYKEGNKIYTYRAAITTKRYDSVDMEISVWKANGFWDVANIEVLRHN